MAKLQLFAICVLALVSFSYGASIQEVETDLEELHEIEFREASHGFKCDCINNTCSCCGSLDIARIGFSRDACLSITYLPEEYGIRLTFMVNGKVLITKTISAKNPSQICTGLGGTAVMADVCFDFFQIQFKENGGFKFCVNLFPRILRQKVTTVRMGCFELGGHDEDYYSSTTDWY